MLIEQVLEFYRSLISISISRLKYEQKGKSYCQENTLAALDESVVMGTATRERFGVEIDVQMSADGTPVIIHNVRVDKVTNGTGLVNEMLWSDLKRLLLQFKPVII